MIINFIIKDKVHQSLSKTVWGVNHSHCWQGQNIMNKTKMLSMASQSKTYFAVKFTNYASFRITSSVIASNMHTTYVQHRTYMHVYIHTWIHVRLHTWIHTCTHTNTPDTHAVKVTYTQVNRWWWALMMMSTDDDDDICIHLCMHTSIYIYIHTYKYACIHTQTQTYLTHKLTR